MDNAKKELMYSTCRQFMEIGLGGEDPGVLRQIVDENVVGLGTAIDEKIRGIEEVKKLLDIQKAQSEGFDISWRIVPISQYTSADEDTAVFADDVYLTIQTGEKTIDMYVRFSVVLHYVDGQWKVIHWHGSKPEQVESEKDTWGVDIWKQKAEELEHLVEEKTADLLHKNRELQIEAALEKVRAVAMGMQQPEDMLRICTVISQQLVSLGLKNIRNVQTAIFNPERGTYMNYEYYARHDKTLATDIYYLHHPMHLSFAQAMMKGPNEEVREHLEGQALIDWLNYQKTTNQFADEYLLTAESLNYYWFSLGPVALGISTYAPLTAEESNLFKRFMKVFELAYQRYLDIEKALAQAKEAQIEAALEKVRSRSLAVNRSDEFNEVVKVVFEKLNELHIPVGSVTIGLTRKGTKDFDVYGCGEGNSGLSVIKFILPYFPNALSDDIIAAQSSAESGYYSKVYSEADKNRYYEFAFKNTELKNLPDDVKQRVWQSKSYALSVAYAKNSTVMVNEFEGRVLNDDQADILKRFSRVFEQAYTRFLDLQKAEANAREAEIQLALERVRARSLAMHHTDELQDVVNVVAQQLLQMGIDMDGGVFIAINDEVGNDLPIWAAAGAADYIQKVSVPFLDRPTFTQLRDAIVQRTPFYTEHYGKADKNEFFEHLFRHHPWSENSPERKAELLARDGGYARSVAINRFTSIGITNHHGKAFSPTDNDILRRFGSVLEQSYTRFLDLQKAEKQTREAQIEVAVERVRAKALAMHKSEEIISVNKVLLDELGKLQIPGVISTTIYQKEDDGRIRFWDLTAMEETEEGQPLIMDQYLRLEDCPDFLWFQRMFRSEEKYFIVEQDRDELKRSLEWIRQSVNEEVALSMIAFFEETNSWHVWHPRVLLDQGIMNIDLIQPPPAEVESILIKMGAAFDLAHKRFIDLKKAEAQAREAQIEGALERVRSRSISMRKSEEIADIAAKIFSEMRQLDLHLNRVLIWTFNDREKYTTWWSSNPEVESTSDSYRIDYNETPAFLNYLEAWQQRKPIHLYTLAGEVKRSFEDYLFAHTEMAKLPTAVKNGMLAETNLYTVSIISDYGIMMSGSLEPLSDLSIDIIQRFGRVFQQSYTRYLDVQKAEAQAREAQIEASLERVRSKTMAMHNSQDVGESVATLFEELISLGVLHPDERCGIGIMQPDHRMEAWTAAKTADGKAELTIGYLDMTLHPLLASAYSGWIEKKSVNQYVLEGDDKIRYHEAMLSQPNYKIKRDYYSGPTRIIHTDFYFKEGCLYVFSQRELSPESENIYIRFATVFGQTYRRYQDLLKAEAQAREAQIEAALEKVRSRTMAMQKPEELADTAHVLFDQLKDLGVTHERINIGIVQEAEGTIDFWLTEQGGNLLNNRFIARISEPTTLFKVYQAWKAGSKSLVVDLHGSELDQWIQFLHTEVHIPFEAPVKPVRRVHTAAMFSKGMLILSSPEPLAPEALYLLERFAGVFDLTYTRFNDLKTAEAQALEATKQASLDRVRAVIASMRSTEDLDMITPLIFRELTTLGVPFIRCGVFIIHEDRQIIDAYLSSPTGESLGVLHLPFGASELTMETVKAWREGQVHRQHWNQEDFITWTKQMMEQHQIESSRTYQGADTAPESLDLHFVPFAQGMLYVGSLQALGDQDLELALALAKSFSIAYARYEDFVKLETAKANVESTLSELKSTQAQLIQSEKMASLGELTAGIAHEIQNPLNFVNNFSEINAELSDEILDAAAKGDIEEVKALASDIKSNQEKIREHGKRADSIVKGMLQHSRSSAGNKEPTDLAALSDEYLRLAYHGMRAKDKSFNATLKTEFDTQLPLVPVVSQDICRVLLNLFNNAFYAVHEKSKTAGPGYEPTVTVRTSLTPSVNGNPQTAIITVADNGPGISESIKEKIFQPFFTTKPTGQGTGLGLSLSYDIVKAHGGNLNVEKSGNDGTTFTIVLAVA